MFGRENPFKVINQEDARQKKPHLKLCTSQQLYPGVALPWGKVQSRTRSKWVLTLARSYRNLLLLSLLASICITVPSTPASAQSESRSVRKSTSKQKSSLAERKAAARTTQAHSNHNTLAGDALSHCSASHCAGLNPDSSGLAGGAKLEGSDAAPEGMVAENYPSDENLSNDSRMASLNQDFLNSRHPIKTGGRVAVPGALEAVEVYLTRNGEIVLGNFPRFSTGYGGKLASKSSAQQIALYTLDPKLQKLASELVRQADAPHVAIVAMEPDSGRILALAQKSSSIPNLLTHAGFPAASLFKVVTTAAALEQTDLEADSVIRFRGGTYVLERWNYLPDPKRDRNMMTIQEALGRSCNAVFGRIALKNLGPDTLRQYVQSFGFNQPLKFERPLPVSRAEVPSESYELSRTAAGFGEVRISPIHAAVMMSGVANEGIMPRPYLVDKVLSSSGATLFESQPQMSARMIQRDTARKLLRMMESTTTKGTSRKDFMSKNRPVLGDIEVAAKTGTLRGTNPAGLNQWFIAAAPIKDPKIAVSVIVLDPRSSKSRSGRIGRMLIEQYLK